MKETRYKKLQKILKEQIQQGKFNIGEYLPSENELCSSHKITRTTARKALDELMKEGFIVRQQGKGSMVRERRESLGLLNVKGFSEAVGHDVKTIFLQKPAIRTWNLDLTYRPTSEEIETNCIHFERLRCVNNVPITLENNWLSAKYIPDFVGQDFIDGSFFKTLSQRYLIEITGSEQELRALPADEYISNLLQIKAGFPLLQITIKFMTSNPSLNIYSQLYCNTTKYPIGNSYFLK